jgi:hypothetical protein
LAINSAAFFHWPTVWVGTRPLVSGDEVDLTTIGEVVFEDTLSVGIGVMALREGMFIFDFSNWPPGQAPAAWPIMPTFQDMQAVVYKRVIVLNSYLACLYTAFWRRQERVIRKLVLSPSELILPELPLEEYCRLVWGWDP